jgi:hypothetical protein
LALHARGILLSTDFEIAIQSAAKIPSHAREIYFQNVWISFWNLWILSWIWEVWPFDL